MNAADKRLDTALSAARDAGRLLMRSLGNLRPSDILSKSRNNFVTHADRASEALITGRIRRRHFGDAVLGEETGHTGSGSVRWIVDPLDGTSNFIRGIPFFCVSIAVEESGRLVCGVIHDPVRRETYAARAGRGTRLNGRRVRVSGARRLSSATVGTGIPYRSLEKRWKTYETILRGVAAQNADTRRTGSMALDLAYVACGRLDALWAFDQAPWDISAGVLLVREAGGRVSDLWSAEADPGHDLLASNVFLHGPIARIARTAEPRASSRRKPLP